MKNKQGFTLMELLVAIVIVSIIAGIGIIGYSVFFSRGENSYYNVIENNMLLAGGEYFSDHREKLPIGSEKSEVELAELARLHYIEDVKDTDGNICMEGKVVSYIENNSYKYTVCLKCGNYETTGKYCGDLENEITATGVKKNSNTSYVVTNSYSLTEYADHENVLVTFSMGDKYEIAKYEVTNPRTQSTVSCNANNHNSCEVEIDSSGTYRVVAIDKGNNQVSSRYINVKIAKNGSTFQLQGDTLYTISKKECGNSVNTKKVTVKIIKGDPNEEYKTISYKVDNGTPKTTNKLTIEEELESGHHNIEVTVTNYADNVSIENIEFDVSFIIDLLYSDNTTETYQVVYNQDYNYLSRIHDNIDPLPTTKMVDGQVLKLNWEKAGVAITPSTTKVEDKCTYTITGTPSLPVTADDFESYCKNIVYNGSSQTLTDNPPANITFINNTGTNAGEYTVLAHIVSPNVWTDGTTADKPFTCTIQKAKCEPPTNLSVSVDGTGTVSWTKSSNCSTGTYKIGITSNPTTAVTGTSKAYRSTIVGPEDDTATSRIVYIKTVAPTGGNYEDSATNATLNITIRKNTLVAGTGVDSVASYVINTNTNAETATYRFIKGETAKISATVMPGYTWSKWTRNSGTSSQEYLDNPHQNTKTADWDYTATAVGKSYTIHFKQGLATSTASSEEIGTLSCTWGSTCTLTAYANLTGNSLGKGVFPYSSSDDTHNYNANWSFYGWVTGSSSNSTSTTREYANSATFNPSEYATDYYLYAIGRRTYSFYCGLNPTSSTTSGYQYWNPCRTTTGYRTTINVPDCAVPSSTANGTWEAFVGWKGGSNTADDSVHFSELNNPEYNASPTVYLGAMRSIFSRTLKVSYNKNATDATGTVADTTTQQYLNSGINNNSSVSSNSITLSTSTFTRDGFTQTAWLEGSASGKEYSLGATYNGIGTTPTDKKAITMYAKWGGNGYTIHFRQGLATSTASSEEIGTQTCNWGSTCTLTAYANLAGNSLGKGIFPYSSSDEASGHSNGNWKFYGWVTGNSSNSASTTREYANSATFNPSEYSANYYLYAIGRRSFQFQSGIAPTTCTTVYQYWNPCLKTNSANYDYLTSITAPAAVKLTSSANGTWNFLGYYAGNGTTTAVHIPVGSFPDKAGYQAYTFTPAITDSSGIMRAKYQRTLTAKYDANGGSGTVSNTTLTQVYNSGYVNGSTNTKEALGSNSITLANSGFTKTGYSLASWNEGSTSGTSYALGGTYTALGDVVKSTSLTNTMYAKWSINSYDITYNYQENRTYNDDEFLDTGYKINWNRNFVITTKFQIPALGVRHAVITNYNDSATTLTIEVNSSNQLRLYMGAGKVDKNSGTITIPQSTTVTATFTWNASTRAYTLAATASGMSNISITGTAPSTCATGTATNTLITNRDHPRTGTFKKIKITSLTIKDTRQYNTALSDLPSFAWNGWTRDGWYTATTGGTQITTSTKVAASNKTYYARWKTYTRSRFNCTNGNFSSEVGSYQQGDCASSVKTESQADAQNLTVYVSRCGRIDTLTDCLSAGYDSPCYYVHKRTRTSCATYSSTATSTETGLYTCSPESTYTYKYTCTPEG